MRPRKILQVLYGPDSELPEVGERRCPEGCDDPGDMFREVIAVDPDLRIVTLSVPEESEAEILSSSFLGEEKNREAE